MEGNGGFLKDGTEAFVLFLRGAQLVLRSSVLTVLDLDGVNVTLENAEIVPLVGSLLSGKVDLLMAAGVAAEVLLVSLSCSLPLLRTHPPSLLVCCFLVLAGMGATNTASGWLEVPTACVPEGEKKSQRDWSTSLKQARAPGTETAELS